MYAYERRQRLSVSHDHVADIIIFKIFLPKTLAKIMAFSAQTTTVFWPWRHGIVVIASAYRTEDPGSNQARV
jgi:hypothetical protein